MTFYTGTGELASEQAVSQQLGNTRRTPFQGIEEGNTGWFEAVGLQFGFESILVGSASQAIAEFTLKNQEFAKHGREGVGSDALDPYDPKFQEEVLSDQPYLREDYSSGIFLDDSFKSKRRFNRYRYFKRINWEARQKLARQNLTSSITSGLVGIGSADLALGMGGAKLAAVPLKAISRAGATTLAGKAFKAVALTATGSALAGAENYAQESILQATKPTTTPNAEEERMAALKWGAAFGFALTGGAQAFRAGIANLPSSNKVKLRTAISKSMMDIPAKNSAEFLENSKTYLNDLLDESTPADGPLRLTIFEHPELNPAIAKVRKKWEDAGQTVDTMMHYQRRDYDRLMAKEKLDEILSSPNTATDAPAFQRLLNIVLPEGRRQGAADFASEILNTGFTGYENTRAINEGNLDARAPMPIEAVLEIFDHEMHTFMSGFYDDITEHFKAGGKVADIQIDERTTLRLDKSGDSWAQVLHSYVTQLDDVRAGRIDKMTFEAPPMVKKMADRWGVMMENYLDLLDLAGKLDGPRKLTSLNDQLTVLVKQGEEEALALAKNAFPELTLEAPGPKTPRTVRQKTQPITESILADVDVQPAVQRKATVGDVEARKKAIANALAKDDLRPDGQGRLSVDERAANVAEFQDLERRGVDALDPKSPQVLRRRLAKRLAENDLKPGEKISIVASIKKMDKVLKRQRKIREQIEPLQTRIDNAKTHMPQRWLAFEVRQGKGQFITDSVQQFHDNLRLNKDGKRVELFDQEVMHDALEFLDDIELSDGTTVRQAAKAHGELWEIRDDIAKSFNAANGDRALFMDAYDNATSKYFDGTANKLFESIANLENSAGIDATIPSGAGALKHRVFHINHGRFIRFLDQNPRRMIQSYNDAVRHGGAEAISIFANKERLGPRVKAALDEELDGTYAQLERALGQEIQTGRNAINDLAVDEATRKKLADSYDNAMGKDIDLVRDKGDELLKRGKMHTQEGVVESLWAPLRRTFFNMPYIAWMGKMVPASWSDAAAVNALNNLDGHRQISLAKQLLDKSELDKRDVQMMAVMSEQLVNSRSQRFWELDTLPEHSNTAGRPFYAAAMAVNKLTQTAANALPKITGMNIWNREMKYAAAVSATHRHADNMRSFVKIANAIGELGDNPTQKQIDKVFRDHPTMSKNTAAMWQRQGWNAKSAREYVDILYEHGLDFEGKSLKDQMSFEEFMNYKEYVHPNVQAWNKSNREMANLFVTSINTVVNGTIVDPNMMSRPLVNQKWFGKAFNQFWSFSYALSTQTVPLMRQQGAYRMGMWMSQSAGLGILTEASMNWIAGRKTWEESANDMIDNPLGVMWRGIDRSGHMGWMTRPFGAMDKAGIGPGTLLNANVGSSHGTKALEIYGHAGPGFDVLNRAVRGISPLLMGKMPSAQQAHTLRTIMPYQNMIWTDLGYRISSDLGLNNPFGRGTGFDLFQTKPLTEHDKRGQ